MKRERKRLHCHLYIYKLNYVVRVYLAEGRVPDTSKSAESVKSEAHGLEKKRKVSATNVQISTDAIGSLQEENLFGNFSWYNAKAGNKTFLNGT